MKRSVSCLLFISCLMVLSSLYADTQTVSTFYPPPIGNYNGLSVNGNVGIGTSGAGNLGIGTVTTTGSVTVYSSRTAPNYLLCFRPNGAVGYCDGTVDVNGRCTGGTGCNQL